MKNKTEFNHLLIEIGTEEVPANYLAYAAASNGSYLKEKLTDCLTKIDENQIYQLGEVEFFLTPRRIILQATHVQYDLKPREEVISGPPYDKCFDASGNPMPALIGFLKSKNIALDKIEKMNIKGKDCVAYRSLTKPQPFKAILPILLEAWLKSLSFPKLMWWDDSGVRFPRPIRNVLVFLNDQLVPAKIGHLSSQKSTRIFKNADRKEAAVASAKTYFALLQKNKIQWNQEKRRDYIVSRLKSIVQKYKGAYQEDSKLLEEVTYLTENPVVLSGSFDPQFVALPPEVLKSSLSKSQRLFSVFNNKDEQLPYYICVLDGQVQNSTGVLQTISSILKAKLQDSRFFYEEDLKAYAQADKLRTQLNNLLFLKDAGSMADKIERMQHALNQFAQTWGYSEDDKRNLQTAITWCKVDLLSQMVAEFPDLQGIMGSYYLQSLPSMNKEIALAVKEHYLPLSPDSPCPKSRLAAFVSIADKADLIIACFALGKEPTASQDPYALKRSMASIIRIALEHKLPLHWQSFAQNLLENFSQKFPIKKEKNQIVQKLVQFYEDRLSYLFNEKGYSKDWIQAVLQIQNVTLQDMEHRLRILKSIYSKPSFIKAHKIIERTSNILKGVTTPIEKKIAQDALVENEEKKLHAAFEKTNQAFLSKIKQQDYAAATSLYADAFFDILHVFFDRILVHAEDPKLRSNRLALVASVRDLYTQHIADLSAIKIESQTQ